VGVAAIKIDLLAVDYSWQSVETAPQSSHQSMCNFMAIHAKKREVDFVFTFSFVIVF
jgi:hypothetical protein